MGKIINGVPIVQMKDYICKSPNSAWQIAENFPYHSVTTAQTRPLFY